MEFKEAVKIFSKKNAKAFLVGQDTNDLLAKDSKPSEVLEMDGKLGYNDNLLYNSYLDTANLKNSEKV
ncbi:MAG: hypothetical protein WAQ98_09320 [Blastocatellia bacterium]